MKLQLPETKKKKNPETTFQGFTGWHIGNDLFNQLTYNINVPSVMLIYQLGLHN